MLGEPLSRAGDTPSALGVCGRRGAQKQGCTSAQAPTGLEHPLGLSTPGLGHPGLTGGVPQRPDGPTGRPHLSALVGPRRNPTAGRGWSRPVVRLGPCKNSCLPPPPPWGLACRHTLGLWVPLALVLASVLPHPLAPARVSQRFFSIPPPPGLLALR